MVIITKLRLISIEKHKKKHCFLVEQKIIIFSFVLVLRSVIDQCLTKAFIVSLHFWSAGPGGETRISLGYYYITITTATTITTTKVILLYTIGAGV